MKKDVTDFRKTVEAGVDPGLVPYKDLEIEKTLKENSTFNKRIKSQTGSHLSFFLPGFSFAYSLQWLKDLLLRNNLRFLCHAGCWWGALQKNWGALRDEKGGYNLDPQQSSKSLDLQMNVFMV